MIKFFRKIRQQLAYENNVSKYTRYAIGEIVLVVIGILIALQVNNWKENISIIKSEKKYMQNLKEDLQNDILLFDNYLTRNRELFKMIDSTITYLSREDFKNTSDKSSYYARTISLRWNRVQPVERTFEQMKSSGQLKIISNQIVSDKISDYYNSIYELETYNQAILMWLEGYLKCMGKVYDGEVLFEILRTNAPVETDNDAIITENPTIINELITSAQYVYGGISLSETIVKQNKSKAEKLILEIDKNYN